MSRIFQKNTAATIDDPKIEVQNNAPKNDIGDVIENLIDVAPEVQPHVIEHFEKLDAQNTSEFSEYTDRFGVKFDPAIHLTGKDGRPTISKTNKLMRKPGAATGASASRPQSTRKPTKSTVNAEPDLSAQQPAQADLKPEHKATGIALTGAIMALAVAIGGEEFNPIKRDDLGLDERTMLENASAEWLRAKNMVDLPPDAAFAIAILSYVIPRFTMPKTQNRIKLLFQWVGSKYVGWRAKRGLKL